MPSITLPIWQPAGAIALPCIILFIFAVRKLWQKRRRRKRIAGLDAPSQVFPQAYGNRIHQEMVAQQIDAVFNALNAVIESERVKLKALLLHQWEAPAGSAKPVQNTRQNLQGVEPDVAQDFGRKYLLNDSRDSVLPEDLAEEDHLSRNEAALVRKLQYGTGQKRLRLETVA